MFFNMCQYTAISIILIVFFVTDAQQALINQREKDYIE